MQPPQNTVNTDARALMGTTLHELVGTSMHETFGGMFGWPVESAAPNVNLVIDRPVRSHVLLRESDQVCVDVVLDFDARLLSLAGAQIYPADMQDTPEMYDDMAAEVANIIAGGIKAYLNRSGHDLRMVEQSKAAPAAEANTPPAVDVSFHYDSGAHPKPPGIVVHVRLKDFPV